MIEQAWLEYQIEQRVNKAQMQNQYNQLKSAYASIEKYQGTLPLVNRRVNAMKSLSDSGVIAEARLLELQEHQVTQVQGLQVEQAKAEQILNAIESDTQGLIYKMRLKMLRSSLQVGDKDVELLPGMSVTAEIKTGKRRLIEFFLSPLLRYKAESIRER